MENIQLLLFTLIVVSDTYLYLDVLYKLVL